MSSRDVDRAVEAKKDELVRAIESLEDNRINVDDAYDSLSDSVDDLIDALDESEARNQEKREYILDLHDQTNRIARRLARRDREMDRELAEDLDDLADEMKDAARAYESDDSWWTDRRTFGFGVVAGAFFGGDWFNLRGSDKGCGNVPEILSQEGTNHDLDGYGELFVQRNCEVQNNDRVSSPSVEEDWSYVAEELEDTDLEYGRDFVTFRFDYNSANKFAAFI